MAMTAKEKREKRENALRAEGASAAIEKLNKESTLNPGAVADAKGPITRPSAAGQKVVVACKLGVAYFDIQLCKIEEKFEQNMQGGRLVNEAIRVGEVVRLRGTAYPRGTPPKGFPPAPEIIEGAALNYGIAKDWFDEWLRQNKLNPLVMNRMIFARESAEDVRAEAKELSALLSGLDPINPEKDARMPRSTREEVSDIETEDARKGKRTAHAG